MAPLVPRPRVRGDDGDESDIHRRPARIGGSVSFQNARPSNVRAVAPQGGSVREAPRVGRFRRAMARRAGAQRRVQRVGDAGARHAQNRAGKRGEDARGPRVRGGRARVFALAQAREADLARRGARRFGVRQVGRGANAPGVRRHAGGLGVALGEARRRRRTRRAVAASACDRPVAARVRVRTSSARAGGGRAGSSRDQNAKKLRVSRLAIEGVRHERLGEPVPKRRLGEVPRVPVNTRVAPSVPRPAGVAAVRARQARADAAKASGEGGAKSLRRQRRDLGSNPRRAPRDGARTRRSAEDAPRVRAVAQGRLGARVATAPDPASDQAQNAQSAAVLARAPREHRGGARAAKTSERESRRDRIRGGVGGVAGDRRRVRQGAPRRRQV